MTTLDDAMAFAAHELDTLIERYLKVLETRIRLEITLTGPEDEAALDRPPDPESPWRRITVEESVMLEREKLLAWRTQTLEQLRAQFTELLKNASGQK
jgi:hypothetical protein